MTDARTRVGVVFGGRSAEREVSLASGRQVYYNLEPALYEPTALFMDGAGALWRLPEKLVIQNTCPDIEARLAADAERVAFESLPDHVDIVFVALHGKYGDDGCIQGLLELLDLPYTGSGVLPCAFSLDKPAAHALLAAGGFDVPRGVVVHEASWRAAPDVERERIAAQIGYPCVVLPAREGSSLGVSMVDGAPELDAALAEAFRYDLRALVEERIVGLEFSVIVLGNEEPTALLPTEVWSENAWMTYEDKYMPGQSQKVTPARVDLEALERIQHGAEAVYSWFGFQGYARLDGFLAVDGRLLFPDPNSTSGMAPSSFMFHQAAEAGLAPSNVIDQIVQLGLAAHAAKKGPL